MQWILFDDMDRPIRITTPGGAYPKSCPPAESTLRQHGAAYARPAKQCTSQQYEDARRAMQPDSRRQGSSKRRRSGGHGYSGGDGMVDL